MKKLVLTAFAAVLIPTLVSAQGTLSFQSDLLADPNGPSQRILLESTGGAAGAGTTAQLWWSPTQNGVYSSITGLIPVSNTSGRITTINLATTGAATAGGADAWFYVAGANNGLNAFGRTINFLNPTGNPAANPPGLPANMSGWNASVGPVLLAVPEPSVIALAGLGLASLLIFRRRK